MEELTKLYRDIILITMRSAVGVLAPTEFMKLLQYFTDYFAEVE